ncbi:MAG: triacylglycerol lipase [Hungatella sp.]|nr:triacylglycerol lipase [Hungatella sp.]
MKLNWDYDNFLSAAEKVHIHFLRLITGLLTISMWLMAFCGAAAWYQWASCGFGLSVIAPLLLLGALYLGFQGLMVWLCLLCRRLRIAKRLLVWTFMWIPVVNFGLALYVRRLARQEIDHTLVKIELNDVRACRQICATRYPLLLVHGVGFRDFHYFNYWGRIPRELALNGAKVYYGHQEAWGTVEDNARILQEKICEIKKETGCRKVNIIAHSKGGLDSRYLISGLHMEGDVASLTTINTPHRGSALVDLLKRLPDRVYRGVCRMIDAYFRRLGDKNPDAYRASFQLSVAYTEAFNGTYGDKAGVYYQSCASLMKSGFSSKLLCVPYWVLKKLDGPNDGLVTVRSARWGNVRGVMENKRLRGISHGDMIDLTREDYEGFDVKEFYVELVSDLKQRGF